VLGTVVAADSNKLFGLVETDHETLLVQLQIPMKLQIALAEVLDAALWVFYLRGLASILICNNSDDGRG
jgi:hypothetical protein